VWARVSKDALAMPPTPDITLYAAPFSRAFTAWWMLEELGLPYQVVKLDLKAGHQKAPAYLAINPMGKVPAITDGLTVVTENPAICLYLADRYSPGVLAPAFDDPARGAYLRWAVFSTAVLEPAVYAHAIGNVANGFGVGWGDFDAVRQALDHAVTPGPWLLGARFTAADVALGANISVALFNKMLPATPALAAYNERLSARPAYKAAGAKASPSIEPA
jgi:glutathione S-transferase